MTASNQIHNTQRVATTLRESATSLVLPTRPEAVLTAMAETQQELLQFIKMRLDKDSDTACKVIGCRNWSDALEVQSQWAQETVQDYASEMTRMLSIYTGHSAVSGQDKGRAG